MKSSLSVKTTRQCITCDTAKPLSAFAAGRLVCGACLKRKGKGPVTRLTATRPSWPPEFYTGHGGLDARTQTRLKREMAAMYERLSKRGYDGQVRLDAMEAGSR